MLKETLQDRRQKQRMFQSLFLNNGKSQEVVIFEDEFVDFESIQKHLENGGSVFITSKKSQKLPLCNQGNQKHKG